MFRIGLAGDIRKLSDERKPLSNLKFRNFFSKCLLIGSVLTDGGVLSCILFKLTFYCI